MSLSKIYEPTAYEPTIYELWEKSAAFKPRGTGDPYSIVMPPPNANGNLHMGHALTTTLQDILTRYYRMKGRDTIYVPGADHAGFETWVVFERQLRKQGKSRSDYSREDIYAQVWDFVDKQRGTMEVQLRAIGASASWDDLVFTLDKKVIKTVYGTFKKLWDEGLIYRGERIVNYSTAYQTSYADIEVEHRTEKGTLWRIAYPLIDRIGEIVVATTRPETMLGDVAVAVHPQDERYKDLIGTKVLLPIIDREIPIIADEMVDPKFGTGAVKLTPAHDPNDFEASQRHNLEKPQIIGFDGRLIGVPAPYYGMTIDEGREAVLKTLETLELRRGEDEIEHSVGYDYKSGLPIQPLIKEQWFLKVGPLAKRAKEAINRGDISFTPASKKRVLIQYLDNLHDWNLSRQIPWGIPIPAFQSQEHPDEWVFDERVDQETIEIDGTTYHREEDTFDTWFSSGQWPFVTTDYLENGELSKFYPLSVMETGVDLIDRWVARMIMLGLFATDKVPFKHVYLHGMVLDEKGAKMSKSKGNVINPMELITEYGSDAVRLGIVANRSAGQNQAFSRAKVVAGRNFANKLWNIARFIEAGRKDGPVTKGAHKPTSLADHWVVRELNNASTQIEAQLAEYRFAEAADTLYHTLWDSVADWYIEASKDESNRALLEWLLRSILILAHPFAPFVTETIWQATQSDGLLISQDWFKPLDYHEVAAAQFEELQKLVSEARFVAHELPGKQTLVYGHDSLIEDNTALITRLAGLKEVLSSEKPSGLRLAVSGREAWLQVDEQTIYDHQSKLEVRLREARVSAERLEARLSNENYVAKAPAKLIEETRRELEASRELIIKLQAELALI
jgi:valyl-tRNA synthetase